MAGVWSRSPGSPGTWSPAGEPAGRSPAGSRSAAPARLCWWNRLAPFSPVTTGGPDGSCSETTAASPASRSGEVAAGVPGTSAVSDVGSPTGTVCVTDVGWPTGRGGPIVTVGCRSGRRRSPRDVTAVHRCRYCWLPFGAALPGPENVPPAAVQTYCRVWVTLWSARAGPATSTGKAVERTATGPGRRRMYR